MRRPWLVLGLVAALFAVENARAQQAGSYQVSTPVLASNLVVATGANRKLMTWQVTADATLDATQWYVMVWDLTAEPGNGTVTPNKCYAVPAGQATTGGTMNTDGPRFQTGIVIGVSTTGCFNLTASTHAFIAADYQ